MIIGSAPAALVGADPESGRAGYCTDAKRGETIAAPYPAERKKADAAPDQENSADLLRNRTAEPLQYLNYTIL